MTFNINFQYELEQLGIMVDVEATYSNGGGGGDEPPYGPDCESISAVIIDENAANDEDIWEQLGDLYTTSMDSTFVWVKTEGGYEIENRFTGMRVCWRAAACKPPRSTHSLRPFEMDELGREFVIKLVSLQSIIQEMADEKAGEAEADGAGGPDPDEAHDRLQDEGM